MQGRGCERDGHHDQRQQRPEREELGRRSGVEYRPGEDVCEERARDGCDRERREAPSSRGLATERHRDRRGEIAADDHGHHHEERHRPARITGRKRVVLDDRELLVQRRCTRRERSAKSRGAWIARRRDHDQLRSLRSGDEGSIDLSLVDRRERRRLAPVRGRLQRELRPDSRRQRGRSDDAERDLCAASVDEAHRCRRTRTAPARRARPRSLRSTAECRSTSAYGIPARASRLCCRRCSCSRRCHSSWSPVTIRGVGHAGINRSQPPSRPNRMRLQTHLHPETDTMTPPGDAR